MLYPSAGRKGEGMMRLPLLPTLAFLFLLAIYPSPALAQEQPPASYAKDEVDAKLRDLEARIDARLRGVYPRSEVDAQLSALRNLISQNASKAELDARIAQVQKASDDALQAAEQRNKQHMTELKDLIDATAARIPTFPPWIAVLVSIAAAVISVVGIGVSASKAHAAVASSRAMAEATREEARHSTREARAYSVLGEWRSLSGDIGKALALFANPAPLRNPDGTPNEQNHKLLADLGNWYEGMAEQWRHGTVDHEVLRRSGLKDQAREFRDGLHAARATLPELDRQINDWTDLEWLANAA